MGPNRGRASSSLADDRRARRGPLFVLLALPACGVLSAVRRTGEDVRALAREATAGVAEVRTAIKETKDRASRAADMAYVGIAALVLTGGKTGWRFLRKKIKG